MLWVASLGHAVRRLRRTPSFTAAAALTLALGIGGAAAVFTVVNGVLLQPLPYPRAERLVDLSHTLALSGVSSVDQSDATYLLYARDNRVFANIGIYRSTAVNLRALAAATDAGAAPERVSAGVVTPSVMRVLDAASSRGRGLTDADAAPGAPAVVVISDGLWARTFGRDPAVVGRHVAVDGEDREIVGVMPAGFRFPDARTALWLPLPLDPAHTRSAAFDYKGIARLRDGVTVAEATADLARLLPQVPEVFPGRLTAGAIAAMKMQPVVQPLRDVIVGRVSRILWIVLRRRRHAAARRLRQRRQPVPRPRRGAPAGVRGAPRARRRIPGAAPGLALGGGGAVGRRGRARGAARGDQAWRCSSACPRAPAFPGWATCGWTAPCWRSPRARRCWPRSW